MLTIIVPESTTLASILADMEPHGVYNGITYYADGCGGLHTCPRKAAEKCLEHLNINRQLWQELADELTR